MSISLLPFPRFYHPRAGRVTTLPVTRDGVKCLPADVLEPSTVDCFAEISMRQNWNGAVSRGVCGLLPATAFLDGTIMPHERTMSARLSRQESLILEDDGALGKPVLLTTSDLSSLWSEVEASCHPSHLKVSFKGTETSYSLREVLGNTEAGGTTISLAELPEIVIADGHHRAETHARLAAAGNHCCDYLPVCLVDAKELEIGIFLRRLGEVNAPVEDILSKLSRYFTIVSVPKPTAPTLEGTWLMTYRYRHYQLTWHERPTALTTPSAWMVGTVLQDCFGITDPTHDTRLDNPPVDVLRNGLLDLEDASVLTFAGCPVSREMFFSEVAQGRTLPPKSTRFGPRVPSGLVVWKGANTDSY